MDIVKQNMIVALEDQLTDLRLRKKVFTRALVGQAYVVRCEGITLCFDVDPATRVVSNPRSVALLSAPRYSKESAEMLAKECTNGNGVQAVAVHVMDAIDQEVAELDRVLTALKAV